MSKIEFKDRFFSLKAGDEVEIFHGGNRYFVKIDKVTEKKIIIGKDKFWRENGKQIGRFIYEFPKEIRHE